MSKRQATDDHDIPAGLRLKHNVDAMGCLILAVTKDNKKQKAKIHDLKEANNYLHRQVERLDAYTQELENRMAAMEAVLSNLLNSTNHWAVEEMIHQVQATRSYDTTDLDRLLEEAQTEDEEDFLAGFFDDFGQA